MRELLVSLRTPVPGGKLFLLALSCQSMFSRSEFINALQSRVQALTRLIDELSSHPSQLNANSPTFVRAMFEYSLTLLLAERSWVEDYIQSLQKEL